MGFHSIALDKTLRLGALMALMSLTACGFQPLYGEKSSRDVVGQALSQVRVAQIGDRLGVIMTNKLRDDFNPGAVGVTPRYLLTVGLAESSNDESIRPDTTASRTSLSITANWTLSDIHSHKVIVSTQANANTGFDVLQSNDYANVTSRRIQEENLIRQVSEEIEMRVAMALRKQS